MKKLLLVLALLFTLFSCVSNGNKTQQGNAGENEVEKLLPVVSFVDSFKSSHPNWAKNSVTKEQTNDDFIKLVKDTSLLYSLTEGIEVEFSEIRKDKNGKYMGHFFAWHAQNNVEKYKIDKVMFDIVTPISDSLVTTLEEKEKYTCKWNFIMPVKYETFCKLYGEQVCTIVPEPEIEYDDLMDEVSIGLGLFYADIVEIKKVD